MSMTTKIQHLALVVDDNPYNRDLSALSLRYIGFEVVEAETGVQALEMLKKKKISLMVLDLAMPEMDGVTVLRKIRGLEAYIGMHIVVMTANPHMITEDVSDQADLVIQKPIDVMEFSRFLRRLMDAPSHQIHP